MTGLRKSRGKSQRNTVAPDVIKFADLEAKQLLTAQHLDYAGAHVSAFGSCGTEVVFTNSNATCPQRAAGCGLLAAVAQQASS